MDQTINSDQRYAVTRRVTLIGAVVDLALGIAKIIVGKVAFSQSLIADGVHSLSDLTTDLMVVWAAKQASREPDADHPYGHQRIETAATMLLGLILIAVALGIAYNAVMGLIENQILPAPGSLALVVAFISVLAKEWIFQYTIRAAVRLKSDLLRSNAWHSRTDALSSLVVIVGVGGSMLGISYLDAVAAVVVAAMIVFIAWEMVWRGVKELVDTSIDLEQVAVIRDAVMSIDGVVDVHDIRTRRMASDIYLDGHILVDPNLSVSEGHRIGEAVRERLLQEVSDITDITIHVDAEDDETYQRSSSLPLRRELEKELELAWSDISGARDIIGTTLHYLNGSLKIEVRLPLTKFENIEQAHQTAIQLREALDHKTNYRVDIVFVARDSA